MISDLSSIIDTLKGKYGVKAIRDADGIQLSLDGIDEKLILFDSHDEIILCGDFWHEHFEDVEELEDFFEKLFDGSIQVVLKYRGKTPVAHQLQCIENGIPRVMSQTGSLFSPFWRKKKFKTLTYVTANE